NERFRLRAIDVEPPEDRRLVVVVTKLELVSADVAGPLDPRGLEREVVDALAVRAYEAAREAFDGHLVADLEVQHGVERAPGLGERPLERLGLRDRSREPVEDEALARVRLVQPREHHLD